MKRNRSSARSGVLLAACLLVAGMAVIGRAQSPPDAAVALRDWGDPGGEFSGEPDFARSQALCRELRDSEPPVDERPDAATAASLRGCNSEALYYGIGMPRDPGRARLCAFTESSRNSGLDPFAGRAMLMTIYANGDGARRDLEIAIHLACGINGAPAESDGRVNHLAELRARRWQGADFHYCDDITSGLADGQCAAHSAGVAEARREAAFRALATDWTAGERLAFGRLRQAHAAYVEACGREVYAGGTSGGARVARSQEPVRDRFLADVQRLAAGTAPHFTAAQFRAADRALNAQYRRSQRPLPREYADSIGIPGPDQYREAARAWLRYRNAFLDFARLKFPNVSRESMATWLTRERTNGEAQCRDVG